MIYTELKHASHPHILKPETSETPFTCDGCKEAGWGLRFRCADCNYDLHKDCALSETYISHPFYGNCSLRFRNRGPADTRCNACGKLALGFVYTSGDCSLHPCCAKLQISIENDGIELHLRKRTWTTKCGKCQSRNFRGRVGGWSYRSADKDYHFHVSCVKDMVKDLVLTRWEREHVCGNMDIASVIPELVSSCGSVGNSWRRKMKNTTLSMVAIVLNLCFSIVLGDPLGVTVFFTSLI
ncbi:hypothetical protein ACHQM5_021384 [Ranunculus cassubicifolius]